ncbi:hypothetical protein X777_16950 [Ooceraea biroi]|uniref:Uncharacterized protein n=1 Tax=Ooceraea biroi TaxID=2015173 RepID=A0A026WSG5_OOCBI|nr:hypothetical protein X777_16950 [Ooceraea biroi]
MEDSRFKYDFLKISQGEVWWQCNGEPKNSAFIDSLPNELYTKPYYGKSIKKKYYTLEL